MIDYALYVCFLYIAQTMCNKITGMSGPDVNLLISSLCKTYTILN